jgi:galactokinase
VRLFLAFQQAFPSLTPEWVIQAAGRDMWAAATADSHDKFTVAVPDMEARTTFNFRSAKTKTTTLNRPLPRWARYPAGVILNLRDYELGDTGLQVVVVGTEPPGPRYEHAIGMATATLWYHVHQKPYTTDVLLELVERVRREYVET